MKKRGRPPYPDILTPREWEVLDELRGGKSNPEIASSLGISRNEAKYHVSEILGKLGVANRFEAAAWQRPTPMPWWRTASAAFLAWPFRPLLSWPFNNLWWGAGTKAAATVAVVATVAAFAIPEGFGLFVTDPEIGPIPDYSDFSYVTADGRVRLTDNPARDAGGAWSPDCSRISFASDREGSIGRNGDIYTMNAEGTDLVNLTKSPRNDSQPTWSPDGERIAFASAHQGNTDIYLINADGAGQANLTQMPGLNLTPAWSPSGEQVLFTRVRGLTPEVYVMNVDGSSRINLTQHEATDGWASWSPDGSKIAFASNRHGDWRADPLWLPTLGTSIYVMNAEGGEVTRLTESASTDVGPRWSPDGEWLSFTRVEIEGPRVYIMRSDGSELRFVVEGHGGAWSSCGFESR